MVDCNDSDDGYDLYELYLLCMIEIRGSQNDLTVILWGDFKLYAQKIQ